MCLELDMFLHSGLPGQVRTATTDTRRTLQASKRLDYARDNIARLDDEASRDYHAYREAETQPFVTKGIPIVQGRRVGGSAQPGARTFTLRL